VLGGDGTRYAALAYRLESADAGGPTGCRLALLDLDVGAVVGTHDVCGPGEAVRDVAVEATAGGPVAYLTLWRGAAAGAGEAGGWRPDGRGRVVALAAETGRVLAVHAAAGVPDRLLLGPAPGGGGRRVYYLETALPPPDGLESWRLVGLDAATLITERTFALPDPPHGPALAPDGARLYALTADAGGGGGRGVLTLDLATGAVARLPTLPGAGVGLVATARALYVLDPDRGRLLILDRRRGRLLSEAAVGRTAVALTLRPER
jgi:hypothetical protein